MLYTKTDMKLSTEIMSQHSKSWVFIQSVITGGCEFGTKLKLYCYDFAHAYVTRPRPSIRP